jgi:mono/diheme cytochrome c family protein
MKRVAIFLTGIVLLSACGESDSSKDRYKDVPVTAVNNGMKIGEEIFLTNCKMCHAATTESSTGNAPSLDSVKYHWPDRAKLGKYIKNAKENLNQDAYTTALYEKYKGKLQMPPYEGLSDEELAGVIDYLYSLSK